MAVFLCTKISLGVRRPAYLSTAKAESTIVLFLLSCYTCFIKVYEQLMTSYENEISCLFCSES